MRVLDPEVIELLNRIPAEDQKEYLSICLEEAEENVKNAKLLFDCKMISWATKRGAEKELELVRKVMKERGLDK
jgi:hypothetical protein